MAPRLDARSTAVHEVAPLPSLGTEWPTRARTSVETEVGAGGGRAGSDGGAAGGGTSQGSSLRYNPSGGRRGKGNTLGMHEGHDNDADDSNGSLRDGPKRNS